MSGHDRSRAAPPRHTASGRAGAMAAAAVRRTRSQAFMRWHEHAFSSTGRLRRAGRASSPGHLVFRHARPPPGRPAHLCACWHIHSIRGTFVSIGFFKFLHSRANHLILLEIHDFYQRHRKSERRCSMSARNFVHCRATHHSRPSFRQQKARPGNGATADPGRALKLQPNDRRAYLTIWMLVFEGPKASTNS